MHGLLYTYSGNAVGVFYTVPFFNGEFCKLARAAVSDSAKFEDRMFSNGSSAARQRVAASEVHVCDLNSEGTMVKGSKLIGRQRKGQGAFFEQEADEFVGDDSDDGGGEADGRKRKVRFNADIDEQDGGAGGAGGEAPEGEEVDSAEEDYDSEDSLTEQQRYEKESGFKLEPFNMKTERDEGYEIKKGSDGLSYVEMPGRAANDGWLDEYDEKWAKKMVRAAELSVAAFTRLLRPDTVLTPS